MAAIADLSGRVADWSFYTAVLSFAVILGDLITLCGREEDWPGWTACATPGTWLGIALQYWANYVTVAWSGVGLPAQAAPHAAN